MIINYLCYLIQEAVALAFQSFPLLNLKSQAAVARPKAFINNALLCCFLLQMLQNLL